MSENLTSILQSVPLLQNLDRRDVERLARSLSERTFSAGTVMTQEGQKGVGFFVILDGIAKVSVGGEERRTLGSGDYFGEVALLDDGPRTATITAATDVRCAGLTSWQFRPFVEEHPQVAWTLLETLAGRLRDAQSQTPAR
jgi:CRP-like cAMP-binding protein